MLCSGLCAEAIAARQAASSLWTLSVVTQPRCQAGALSKQASKQS